MTTRFPQAFGRFWLQEKIGHGGMAEVFRATVGPDPETYAFDIALKRLHPHLQSESTQVDMFMTEADVAKFLLHDNIVRVYESGLFDGQAYIAMEYVWGLDLAQVMLRLRQKRLRLPSDLSVFIALQILRALDYVHRAVAPGGASMDMVHRDVTPSNIYLTYDGQVKLADFGVARVSFLERHEEAQTLKGKVSYMPPEVLVGHPVDSMVDLWSLAVTLYEMVTMRRVYEGVSEADLVAGVSAPAIEPAHKISSDIDVSLSRILVNALHKKRKRRPKEAVDLYRSLKSYLEELGVMHQRDALGRFLRETVGGNQGPAPSSKASSDAGSSQGFLEGDYHAPIEMSPTQRLELTEQKQRWVVPVVAVSLLAVTGAGAAWWLTREEEPPTPVGETAPKDASITPVQPPEPPEPEPELEPDAAPKPDAPAPEVESTVEDKEKPERRRKRRRRKKRTGSAK